MFFLNKKYDPRNIDAWRGAQFIFSACGKLRVDDLGVFLDCCLEGLKPLLIGSISEEKRYKAMIARNFFYKERKRDIWNNFILENGEKPRYGNCLMLSLETDDDRKFSLITQEIISIKKPYRMPLKIFYDLL